MRDTPARATYLYLLLTLAFSSVFWGLIIWSGHLAMAFGLMVVGVMWCPALAAVVSCRLPGRSVRSLAWRWPKNRYIAAAYFVPLAYAAVAYGGVWALRLGGWNSQFVGVVAKQFGLRGMPAWGSLTLYILILATGGMIRSLSTALGEEIGWRGFLVPELAKQMSFTKLSLLSGIIWAAWHSPVLLFADYNSGTNRWYALGCFTLMVVAISFIFAWMRLKSGSLWPAALLHASHNLFVQAIFDNLMRNTGRTLWYTTEFGIALALSGVAFAVYFWTRRSEVECTPAAQGAAA
ncbi:MAG TPA: CPBP family intramembrane glutamic endopeptidase [Terriglobales bacterium]|nr:CPBP family intramembrane glutamic endopeptidase [Terriglobales bacterium]